ncbi:MAG: hypothetical protein OEY63_05600 [Gemmatimonadota bacterium]|nr:hypothetical protein [Gemmatimonadota bacterium]
MKLLQFLIVVAAAFAGGFVANSLDTEAEAQEKEAAPKDVVFGKITANEIILGNEDGDSFLKLECGPEGSLLRIRNTREFTGDVAKKLGHKKRFDLELTGGLISASMESYKKDGKVLDHNTAVLTPEFLSLIGFRGGSDMKHAFMVRKNRLQFDDPESKTRFLVELSEANEPSLQLSDKKGEKRLELGWGDTDRPVITLHDEDGNQTHSLGAK